MSGSKTGIQMRSFFVKIPHLLLIGNRYYFQYRIPSDVQDYFACTHLKKSLKTTSKVQAKTEIKLITANVVRAIFMIRTKLLTPDLILQIVTDVKEGLLEMHSRHGSKLGESSKLEQFNTKS